MTYAILVSILLSGLRIFLAAVFVVAGLAKLRGRSRFRDTLTGLGLPDVTVAPLTIVLPVFEIIIGVGLLTAGDTARAAGVGVFGLSTAIAVMLGLSLRRPTRPPCNCFGSLSPDPISIEDVTRAVLLALAGLALSLESPTHYVPLIMAPGTPMSLVPLFVIFSCCVGVLTTLTRRATRMHFARHFSDSLDDIRASLSVGKPAPAFELMDVNGNNVTLAQLCGRGTATALIFVDPTCPTCKALASAIKSLLDRAPISMTIALIGSGSAQSNAAAFGTRLPLLLQKSNEVQRAYFSIRTPSAVFVDAQGRIDSGPIADPAEIKSMIVRLASTEGPATPISSVAQA